MLPLLNKNPLKGQSQTLRDHPRGKKKYFPTIFLKQIILNTHNTFCSSERRKKAFLLLNCRMKTKKRSEMKIYSSAGQTKTRNSLLFAVRRGETAREEIIEKKTKTITTAGTRGALTIKSPIPFKFTTMW